MKPGWLSRCKCPDGSPTGNSWWVSCFDSCCTLESKVCMEALSYLTLLILFCCCFPPTAVNGRILPIPTPFRELIRNRILCINVLLSYNPSWPCFLGHCLPHNYWWNNDASGDIGYHHEDTFKSWTFLSSHGEGGLQFTMLAVNFPGVLGLPCIHMHF